MTSPFTTKAESESIGTGLAVPLGDPKTVFRLGGTLPFVRAVEEHVAALKPQLDISTETGRDFIRSTAYKIARTKTFAFAKAKELSAVYKAMGKEIDTEAEEMSKALDKLKHEIRRPLTEWEERDSVRNADYETKLGEIYNACLFVGAPTVEAIQARLAKLRGYESIDWAEYSERAKQGFAECFPALWEMLAKAEKDEADREELEELRKLKASMPVEPVPFKPSFNIGVVTTEMLGEAIPPKATPTTPDFDDTIADLLALKTVLLDYDQAWDVLNAIKAGKIRHVTISY